MCPGVERAKFYIARCTPWCGAFRGTSLVHRFIDECANEINGPLLVDPIFPGDSKMRSPIAIAMKMIAPYHMLRSPEAQVGATFLVVTLENCFRQISGLLDWEGKWMS